MNEEETYELPKLKYLHEASYQELLDALEVKFKSFLFAGLNPDGDDADSRIVQYHGGIVTALGLAEAAKFEMNCQIYRSEVVE